MALIKTTTELKQYLPVNKDFNVEGILPFVAQAETDFIIPNISQEQYDDLNDEYNAATPSLSPEQEALLAKIQPALAHFAFNKWIPFGQVLIDSAGIRIANTETMKTAFQWQTDKLEESSMQSAYSHVESLLTFMEANIGDYALWSASAAYTVFKESFINTANEFSKYVNINNSRLTFVSLKAAMKKAEDFDVKKHLDTTTFDAIKAEILAGSITPTNETILTYVKPAVAHLTLARALQSNAVVITEKGFVVSKNVGFMIVAAFDAAGAELKDAMIRQAQEDGNAYLKQLFNYLNPDDAESTTRPEIIDNTGHDGIVGI